ncbi:hypothetical protein [Paraburkholderia silvatlantica]|uniref:Uncharacterized protein n=1 Tax=Paraburkholderia silvatlantica TaxID=321895 RepID=A0ABR6FGZ2_9BURK|nr:hypothetical protein [Paraburkholderia silvatlantica]MBB2926686.1 hypothetical protein [Paraburkholderia silvatlantica]
MRLADGRLSAQERPLVVSTRLAVHGPFSARRPKIALGLIQRNVVLGTTGGTIVMGPGGLPAALVDLDLIAKNVQIEGPLNNTFSSGTALTRILEALARRSAERYARPRRVQRVPCILPRARAGAFRCRQASD